MYLSAEEAKHFFKLWLGLLSYVNQKYRVEPEIPEMKSPKGLDIQKIGNIRNKLWEEESVGKNSVIDEYIKSNKTLIECEIRAINDWKNRISNEFIIVRHQKNGSVFMNTDKPMNLYCVIGISNPISEIIPQDFLPIYTKATLIPFEGKIIYDSVLQPSNIVIGNNMSWEIREECREIKKKQGIITNFNEILRK
jgi:hypothetical protein